jgi:hypothetical protein
MILNPEEVKANIILIANFDAMYKELGYLGEVY